MLKRFVPVALLLLAAVVAVGGGAATGPLAPGDGVALAQVGPAGDAEVATIEVRVAARRLADGRTEFALQERAGDGSWAARRLPTRRFFPADAEVGRWLSSSPLTVELPAGDASTPSTLVVRVAAQLLASGGMEFALQERADDASWGERRLPTRRFFPADAAVGRWLSSSALTLTARVEFAPSGDDVPRLATATIGFPVAPASTDGASLVAVDPPIEGSFVWSDERTLLFQPAFPGWQRGQRYELRVDGAASGLGRDFTHAFTVGGGLEVAYVIPGDGDAEVPVEAQVLVQFSRSVAALTVLQEGDAPPVLEFDPPLAGKGEWLNTSLYRFVPDDLRPATTYSVRIPAGLSSAADGVLASDFEWSFETIHPAVESFEPANNTEFVEPDGPFLVTFNQPMDRSSVEARLGLRPIDGPAIPASHEWSERDTVVTLTPRAPLALGREYEVVAPGGLRGATGGVTAKERTASFTVVSYPRLMETRPYNGQTNARTWGIGLTYNNPMDPESFVGRVTISGVDPDDIGVWAYEGDVSVSAPLEHSTRYTVRIAAGVRDRGGRTLREYSFSFTTRPPPLPAQYVSFAAPRDFTTVAADGPQVLHYHSARSEAVDFVLYPLTEAEADTLLKQGYIEWWERPFEPSSDPVREWTEPIAEDLRDQSRLYATTLGGGELLPRGDYLLRAFSERVEGSWAPSAVLMLSVVDTAIVTKLAHDEMYTWVVDYETGAPQPGIEVRVSHVEYSELGDQAAITDADGLARTRVGWAGGRTYPEQVVRVASEGRYGVTSTRWDGRLYGGPYYRAQARGFVYTDRPIYRPGETVYIKGIVRAEDDAAYSLPDVDSPTYWVRVSDPQGNELLLKDGLQLSELGSLATEIVLPALASVGEHSATVGSYSTGAIAGVRFTVAEFRVPEFEVEVDTSTADYVAGDAIATEASAQFYFGSPVRDTDVEWNAFAQPTSIHVEGYEDYSFSDYDYYRRGEQREPWRGDGEARTDASGVARFDVPAVLDDGEGTHEFTISATVTDANAQAVSGSTTVTVHPAAWYAGIKTDSYVAQAEKPLAVHVVSVDYTGQVAPARPVTVRIYEREWERTKQRSASGGYRYRYEIVDTEIQARTVTTNSVGEASFDFSPPTSGTYRLVAESTDEAGRVARSSRFIWVSGRDFVPWPARDDDSIELVADREEYEVGDVARVLVPAPFEGATALVTIERGRVLSSEVRTFETNSELLTIPIEDSHIPNIFVGVVLYRAPTEEDPYPRYVVGYVELPVSTAPRRLDVRVEPDRERAAPGETVGYEVTVTDADGRGVVADVSVAIVDEGVLALTDGDARDAMEAFWYRRELGVRTASSLGVSIDRHNEAYEAAAQGEPAEGVAGAAFQDEGADGMDDAGGGIARASVAETATAGAGKAAPDTPVRSNFQNTALWVGQLTTDDDGVATFELPVPDNTTTWRASAQAVTADTLAGSGSSELLVTQPLIVRPALPRFLRVGDHVGLRALVTNRTSAAREVTVYIEATGVELDDTDARTVRVEPGDSAVVAWPARATAAGTATVLFYGLSADRRYDDAVEMSLPVHLAVTPETTATGGVVEDAPAIEAVYLPDYVITGVGSLELSLQGSLVGALDDELKHFKPYRYESTVRVASRVVATVAVQRATPDGLDDAQQRQLEADVAKLTNLASYEGWSWCQGCPANLWVTGWVLTALGEARDAGHEVPDHVLERATWAITNRVHRETDVERPADPNEHAYLLHALVDASNDGREVSDVARGQAATILAIAEDERANLTNWGRAYVLLGLLASGHATDHPAVRAMLNDLTANTIASANGNHWEDERVAGSMHNASVRITAIVLRALVEVDPGHPLIEETTRWLALARSADRWKSSVERAQGMASLGAYAALTGETRGAYDYSVLVNTDRVLAGHFDVPARDYLDAASVALADLPLGEVSRVQFEREAGTTGRMYYGLNLRYVTPAAGIEALNRGFAVSHRYSLLADPDTAVTSAAVGEVVRVTVTVVAPADRLFVQVEDFLPAGLEPIDPQLNIVAPWVRQQLWEEQAEALRGSSGGYCAPWYGWCFSPWDQVDLRDDRLVLQASRLPQGVHEYVYYARATAPGDFFVVPVHAEETYLPEVFGCSDSSRFTVTSGE